MMENTLDGNAAGGILGTLFPVDMTLAQATCAGCGVTNAIGATAVYMHGMGMVLRCPACDTVLMRIAHAGERYWLDIRGIQVLQLRMEV
jgi:hypothetical protein